ncbi:MAG: tetratricopeptide repeat protein [Elusimicrobia bacterium]|nr:tetratricopeptide repeat protein [Elusimicrobiota bacterium]
MNVQLLFATGAGTKGAAILLLRNNSKLESLAGAGVARNQDISFLSLNPASVSGLNESETLFSQGSFWEDPVRFSCLAYAQPTRWGTLALDYSALNYGEFNRTDENGETTGSQNPKDTVISMAWSTNRKFSAHKSWDFGGSIRYLRSDLVSQSASLASYNFGVNYRTPREGVLLGFALDHMGPPIQYSGDSFPLPTIFRVGIGQEGEEFSALSAQLRYALDFNSHLDGSTSWSAGTEISLLKLLSFRLGYSGEEDIEERFRYGLGIGWEGTELGYSASPSGDLGYKHMVTLQIRFGSGLKNFIQLFSATRQPQTVELATIQTTPTQEERMIANLSPTHSTLKPKNVPILSTVGKVKTKTDPQLNLTYKQALRYMKNRNLDGAIRLLKRIYDQDKNFEDVSKKILSCYQGRIVRHYSNRRYREARDDIEEALKIDPANPRLKAYQKTTEQMLSKQESKRVENTNRFYE